MLTLNVDFKSAGLYIGGAASMDVLSDLPSLLEPVTLVSTSGGALLRIHRGPIFVTLSKSKTPKNMLPSPSVESRFTGGVGASKVELVPEFSTPRFFIADADENNVLHLEVKSSSAVLNWEWFAEGASVYFLSVWSEALLL